jgi:thiamine pyrophosphate-dependent acetolactate synthase large subunit-like protein
VTTGAQALVAALEDAGVEVVFGLPGVHNLAAWTALRESRIRLVTVRHEQTAAYAADGYARTTGKVGVALVTTGPGAANTLAATGEAWASHSPILVIATDIPTTIRRAGVHRGALHECADQAGMFAPVTKETLRVEEADDIGPLVAAAMVIVPSPRPIYLEVPTDLLVAEVNEVGTGGGVYGMWPEDELAQARERIAASERPVIWAGGGARDASAEVTRLAEQLGAPVLTTHSARGVVPPGRALPAPHVREVGELWDQADLVLVVGSDLDGVNTQNWTQPKPPVLIAFNVDADDAAKNYEPDLIVEGDAGRTLAELAFEPREPWADLDAVRAAVRGRIGEEHPDEMDFLDAFAAAVPDDAVVVCDMCIPGYWLTAFHTPSRPRRLLTPFGWGTLGFGFPAAIGATLADGGPVVAVCGDGGILFGAGELATVAQEKLPLTLVIVDDGGYGMLRYDQRRAGETPYGVDLHTPDFVALAASFGIRAEHVDGLGEAFGARLAEHVAAGEPSVLVASAALEPPETTSPRWPRRAAG